MKTKKLTRRSQIGYGYTATCEQVWNKSYTNSWLAPMSTDKPDYYGTIKQVLEKKSNDATLRSFESGGTCYSEGWFVKVRGKWHKITSLYIDFMLDSLYMWDESIVVEYE